MFVTALKGTHFYILLIVVIAWLHVIAWLQAMCINQGELILLDSFS